MAVSFHFSTGIQILAPESYIQYRYSGIAFDLPSYSGESEFFLFSFFCWEKHGSVMELIISLPSCLNVSSMNL